MAVRETPPPHTHPKRLMGKNIYRTWALAGWLQVGPDGFGMYSRFGAARRVKKLRLGCSRNSPVEGLILIKVCT